MFKVKFLLLTCFLSLSSFTYSQRYDNAKNFNLSGGISKDGYSGIFGYEKLINKKTAYVVELEYMNRKAKIINTSTKASLNDFLLNAKFRWYFFQTDDLYLFVSGGLFFGYENFSNKDDIPYSIKMDRDNDILYGAIPEGGAEYNFKKWSLFMSVIPRYEFNYKEFITTGIIGAKFYF